MDDCLELFLREPLGGQTHEVLQEERKRLDLEVDNLNKIMVNKITEEEDEQHKQTQTNI